MYEAMWFEAQKLIACIHAALGWPDGKNSLTDAWNENGGTAFLLVYEALCKHEREITERILEAQPDEIQRLKNALAQERAWKRQERLSARPSADCL